MALLLPLPKSMRLMMLCIWLCRNNKAFSAANMRVYKSWFVGWFVAGQSITKYEKMANRRKKAALALVWLLCIQQNFPIFNDFYPYRICSPKQLNSSVSKNKLRSSKDHVETSYGENFQAQGEMACHFLSSITKNICHHDEDIAR